MALTIETQHKKKKNKPLEYKKMLLTSCTPTLDGFDISTYNTGSFQQRWRKFTQIL